MNYIEKALYRITPHPVLSKHNGQIRMQMSSAQGKTAWLNLTPEQFKAIENLVGSDPAFAEPCTQGQSSQEG